MADAPTPEHAPAKGGSLGILTKKVGPLPLFVWALAAAGIGYYLYRRSHPSSSTSSSTGSTGTAPTDQSTYVPPFDAASLSGGGGIGSSATPGNVYNYYYGDTAAAQAAGGGTATTPPDKTPPASSGTGDQLQPAGPGTPATRGGVFIPPSTSGATSAASYATAGHGL